MRLFTRRHREPPQPRRLLLRVEPGIILESEETQQVHAYDSATRTHVQDIDVQLGAQGWVWAIWPPEGGLVCSDEGYRTRADALRAGAQAAREILDHKPVITGAGYDQGRTRA